MLERCFKHPLPLHRLRGGPAGPFLDGFAESMCAEGYSSETSGSYLHAADHLGHWAARRGVAIADLDEDLLARRDVVCRAIGRAGVRAPSRGTHVLRHSLATRLLRDGATLDTIGAVLRHRDVNTTALYAKVDVGRLRQVAQPWPDPEGSSC